MISSVGSTSGAGLLASVIKETITAQDIDIAVLKKSQDLDKANGESALKLIASATAVKSSGGIDIHV